MDDLADELGISKKTLYAHFPSKIALLEAVLADKFASVEARLKELTCTYPHDFSTALQELLSNTQRELDEIKPPFVRDMRQKAPHVFKMVERRRAELIERHFGKLFVEGQRAGMVRKDIPAKLMIEILLTMVQGIMNPPKMQELGMTPKEGFTGIIKIVLEGALTRQRTEIMNASRLVQTLVSVVCLSLAILFIGGCSDSPQDRFQGYVEGEFVYVASPLAGQLESLQVRRGDQVKTGDPLFALDETAEKAALDMARAALVLSEAEFTRQEKLFRMGPAAAQDYDRARSTRDQDRQRVAQAEWNFNQKRQAAPKAGLVYDTLFRQGEWVAAGKPVVVLLPPQNIKVRAFVPETQVGSIHYGDTTRVTVDGVPNPFIGKVSYISPHAEYTPPVIYSRESRAKLVFMIESVFDPEVSANLHPGQPVDVEFKSK